jgi:inorganic pyrophosphatase
MTLVECYPIGVIKMIDNGSLDEKIIAIPFGDPTYNAYYDVHELPKHVFDEMMHFFEVYKTLEHKKTTVKEICHRDEAVDIINKCLESYKKTYGKKMGKGKK